MKKQIIFILFGLVVLSGCNTNIIEVTKGFCNDRNPEPDIYKYVESTLKNYNYEDTQIKCEYFKQWYSLRHGIIKVYNISCPYDFTCNEYDEWGDCTKGDYDYTCNII